MQTTTHGIAATDGTLIAESLPASSAAWLAQLAANRRGERVWLYTEGDASPARAVEPARVRS